MGTASDDLKRDIDVKREELGAHVAELSEHVAPGRVARRRWQRIRSMLGTSGSDEETSTGAPEGKRSAGPATTIAGFVAGLLLGFWLTRRRYLAKLARADA
jgi:hypothetical protein